MSAVEITTPGGVRLAHGDHGLSAEHLAFIDSYMEGRSGFFIVRVEMPPECPDLMSALYGPDAGDAPVSEDDVTYEKRADRPGPSRLVDLPHRPCRGMVICGIAGGKSPVLFTAYGTQAALPAPREWWDPGMKPLETLEAAQFWSVHALAR